MQVQETSEGGLDSRKIWAKMRIELPQRGLYLEVECHGDPQHPCVMMIMGLGLQLVAWPEELLQSLLDAGYRVVVFDNRDCGLSGNTRRPDQTPPRRALLAHLLHRTFVPAYDLGDMAADTLALADALEIEQFHLVGVSLGGMVAQTLAARHPERVLSLISIMSSAGPDTAPWPSPRMLWQFIKPPPRKADESARIEHTLKLLAMLGRLRDKDEIQRLRQRVTRAARRAYRPDGIARQLLAVLADRDRSQEVAQIRCPTLILHGRDDPLLRLPAADHLKRIIPDARLTIIDGIGHYMPQHALEQIGAEMVGHLQRYSTDHS